MSIRQLTNPEAGAALSNLVVGNINAQTINPPPAPAPGTITDTSDLALTAGAVMIGVSGFEVKQSGLLASGTQNDILQLDTVRFTDNGFVSTLASSALTGNLAFTLPASSGQLALVGTPGNPFDQDLNTTNNVLFNSVDSTTNYQIAATAVLSSTTLGTTVANASITSNTAATFTNSGNITITSGNLTLTSASVDRCIRLNLTNYADPFKSVITTTIGSAVGTIMGSGIVSNGGTYKAFVGANDETRMTWRPLYLNAGNAPVVCGDYTFSEATALSYGSSIVSVDNIACVGSFRIGATPVLSSTTLGMGVANASITSNTAATLTNSGNINLTSGTYSIAGETIITRVGANTIEFGTAATYGTFSALGTLQSRDTAGTTFAALLTSGGIPTLYGFAGGFSTVNLGLAGQGAQNVNLQAGSAYQINGSNVLTSTTVGLSALPTVAGQIALTQEAHMTWIARPSITFTQVQIRSDNFIFRAPVVISSFSGVFTLSGSTPSFDIVARIVRNGAVVSTSDSYTLLSGGTVQRLFTFTPYTTIDGYYQIEILSTVAMAASDVLTCHAGVLY